MDKILEYLPYNVKKEIYDFLNYNNNEIEEIRIRANKPITLKLSYNHIVTLKYTVTEEEITQIFTKICENSVYSYKKQICEGFITIKGGHRVGITGNCVMEDGKIININYISSLNFRIAREIKGSANKILKEIINTKENTIYNTLIVSKPGAGKTTILRDIIRNISNGIPEVLNGKICGVVDERGEIAAMYKGVPQNDVGINTDVIDNVSKEKGMKMLIRSMSPEVIFCDEIGSTEDIDAINYAVCSGVKGVFTAHGDSIEELLLNTNLYNLLNKFLIERIIFLDSKNKGLAKEIYILDLINKKYSSKNDF